MERSRIARLDAPCRVSLLLLAAATLVIGRRLCAAVWPRAFTFQGGNMVPPEFDGLGGPASRRRLPAAVVARVSPRRRVAGRIATRSASCWSTT